METIPFSYAHAYAYVTPGLHSFCLCLCHSVNQTIALNSRADWLLKLRISFAIHLRAIRTELRPKML